jgi:hypothetical protein
MAHFTGANLTDAKWPALGNTTSPDAAPHTTMVHVYDCQPTDRKRS